MFALISGAGIVQAIITLICFGLIFWLLWWLVDYLKLPEPFNKAVRVILMILAVVVIINVLLAIAGYSVIKW